MKAFLKDISVQLKDFSASLNKKSIFIDQPWAVIDEEFEIQKLIFKRDNDLIMSKNGKVSYGKWEYLVTANALLIDRGVDKILCNAEYIDEGVMILSLDGTNNKFFALANENVIPNLDIENYLNEKRRQEFRIKTFELNDGKLLEVLYGDTEYENQFRINTNRRVLIDGNKTDNGEFQLKKSGQRFTVRNGVILSLLVTNKYQTKDGIDIFIEQRVAYSYQNGDKVFKDPERKEKLEDGVYRLGVFKKIKVKSGIIIQ